MPERSQPGNLHPHFAVHRLRRRAAAGLGEQHAEQAEIDRLFVTEPEGGRPDPHVLDAMDVARGFGLPDDQVNRLAKVVHETRANYSTKGAQQHIVNARGTLIGVMKYMTPHIPSDIRQEVLRRAISYWKAQSPVDLGRTAELRFGVQKSGGHKYKSKKRGPGGEWVYDYGEKKKPPKQLALFADVSEPTTSEVLDVIGDDGLTDHQRERKERAESKAAGLRSKAKRQWADATAVVARIPMGQPILSGHHSEKRHRRDLARHDKKARASLATMKEAETAEGAAVRAGSAISSDDPDAVVALQVKLEKLEAQRASYKAHNKGKKKDPDLYGDSTDKREYKLPSYVLSNLGANIRTVKKRIASLEAAAAEPENPDIVGDGFTISEDKDANRIRFHFHGGKPSRDVITKMKRNGFKWSPSESAWQRQLNNAGRYAATDMAKELFGHGLDVAAKAKLGKSIIAVIPLKKAVNAEWGTGPSGSGGPGSRTDSLPDFSIYLSPEYQGRREREKEAMENRMQAMRQKHRGFWGPAPERDPELRYEPQGTEARYVEKDDPKLGIAKPTAMGPKGQVDRFKAAQTPYEQEKFGDDESNEDEDEDSRKREQSRKMLVVRRK